jgi:predicted CoA-binding protein
METQNTNIPACPLTGHESCHEAVVPILRSARTIAVLGCSDNPDRDSYQVAEYLLKRGYRILPVNPRSHTILGQTVYSDLAKILEPIDVVDVFRNAESLPLHVEEIIRSRPGTVWLQPGTVNERVAEELEVAGIRVVKDRCMKVEHRVHGSELNRD